MTSLQNHSAIWIEPSPPSERAPLLDRDPLIARLLDRRGIDSAGEARQFLDARPRPTPSSARLPNLTTAIDRIEGAIDRGERIAIFGDYDVDGMTSTALLLLSLQAMIRSVDLVTVRLPVRAEGYGLSVEAIDSFASSGIELLIAVDCGSNDCGPIARARELGIDVVVLDHHRLHGPTPDGAIIVSAQLSADSGLQSLSAAGVAFLAVSELSRRGRPMPPGGDLALLDLVALGTVGDVMPMLGVNRSLVRDGIRWIRTSTRPGLRALLKRAGVRPETIDTEVISFKIVPRLNAAGRMDDPKLAFDLITARSERAASRLADELETLNDRRRSESQAMLQGVAEMVDAKPALLDEPLLILSSDRWSAGLAGPAAAKLAERHRRPVIVLAGEGEVLQGSARSVPGFDIAGALAAVSGLLERHGGHDQAAGLTVRRDNVGALREELRLVTGTLEMDRARAVFQIDADLEPSRLDLKTARSIDALQPFGKDNPRPLLRVRDLPVQRVELIGQDRTHLRLMLGNGAASVKAVMFHAGSRIDELAPGSSIDLLANVGIDHWQGAERLDVKVVDFRSSSDAVET